MKIGAHIETDIDVKAFLQEIIILPCKCVGSRFIDKDNQHIMT